MSPLVRFIPIILCFGFLASCGDGCHHTEPVENPPTHKENVFEGRKSGGTFVKSTAPPSALPVSIQQAQGFISAFDEMMPESNRFADSYVIEEAYMRSLKQDQAVRIFNSIDPSGNAFYSLFRMAIINNGVDFVMGAPMYWMNNQCTGDDCLRGSGPIDKKFNDKTFPELEAASNNYIAQTKPPGTKDIENSILIKKIEYDAVVAALAPESVATIRFYHGYNGTERVVIIVGVREDGTSIWKDNAVFVGNVNHLCPTACDCL